MATAISFRSPQQLLDYINSITLPAEWRIIDKGAKFTVIDETSTGVFSVFTVNDETELKAALAASVDLFRVVPHKSGGGQTFYSVSDVVAGTNTYSMEIISDQAKLEAFLNTAITLLFIAEHGSQKLVIYS